MGTFFKVIGALVVVAVLLAGAGLAYLAIRKPAMRPPSTEKIEATPARLARGEYLALHVADCLECHSDFTSGQFCLPPKPGTEGQGGYPFDKRLGVPGVVQAQNITPDPETGIGRWTDGEVIRAIREGVDKDGEALFPQMPYPYFRSMSDEDVRSVVAYLRTLKPIHHSIQKRTLDFPVNFLVKNVPRPVDGPVTMPDPEKDHLGYGKYVATIAGCQECHTAHDNHGQLLPGREFAGGWEMLGPWGRVVTANISPHPDTYIGRATKEEFIGRVKSFESLTGERSPIATKGRNTIMPWLQYSGMTNEDLGAIYDYLKTLPPIQNKVESFPDAPLPPTPAPGAVPTPGS
jgi:mono/diheme cytochrome c family protein